jgi:plasmid stabilization system protein ParE
MPRGAKSKYTDKQERKAEHIEEGYRKKGVSEKEAERRAWATVNKDDGGGKKPGGSGRGKEAGHPAAKKGGAAAAGRSAAARSASAKKAAATRKRNAARASVEPQAAIEGDRRGRIAADEIGLAEDCARHRRLLLIPTVSAISRRVN